MCPQTDHRTRRATVEPSIEPPTKHVAPVEPVDLKRIITKHSFESTGSTGSTCFVGGSILGSTLALLALHVLLAHRHMLPISIANNTEMFNSISFAPSLMEWSSRLGLSELVY